MRQWQFDPFQRTAIWYSFYHLRYTISRKVYGTAFLLTIFLLLYFPQTLVSHFYLGSTLSVQLESWNCGQRRKHNTTFWASIRIPNFFCALIEDSLLLQTELFQLETFIFAVLQISSLNMERKFQVYSNDEFCNFSFPLLVIAPEDERESNNLFVFINKSF